MKKITRRAGLPAGRQGFSLPELIIVIAVLIGLYFLSTANLFAPQRTNTVTTTIDTLVSDLASQQNRSMTGDTSAGATNTGYGVYFEAGRYTLFKGTLYSASDPENFAVALNPNIQFVNILFPSSQIVFATGSGTLINYVAGQDTVTVQDSDAGISKTIHINNYGVIDSVN